ncbi:MAG: hypothetical protein VYC95_09575, partial [Verrucomicrobiota bacterium]|nr:hypothetical protein [Verrucomicrobiota bacterium]
MFGWVGTTVVGEAKRWGDIKNRVSLFPPPPTPAAQMWPPSLRDRLQFQPGQRIYSAERKAEMVCTGWSEAQQTYIFREGVLGGVCRPGVTMGELRPVLMTAEEVMASLLPIPCEKTLPVTVVLPDRNEAGMDMQAVWLIHARNAEPRPAKPIPTTTMGVGTSAGGLEKATIRQTTAEETLRTAQRIDSLEQTLKDAIQQVQVSFEKSVDGKTGAAPRKGTIINKGADPALLKLRDAVADAGGDLDEEQLQDLIHDIEEGDVGVGVDDSELEKLFPEGWVHRRSSREQARQATAEVLASLPTSLQAVVQYPSGEYPGFAARDTLNEAGRDYMEYMVGINMKDSKWVRPYLLAMGAALQLLGQLIFTEKALDRQKALRQKALIAMDLLA